MNNIEGFAMIKKDPQTFLGAEEALPTFSGKICRVLEFAADGGVLVVNAAATHIGTFDKEDLFSSFKCQEYGDVICPPDMDELQKMAYDLKVKNRKGGYSPLVRQLVISASLAKGVFSDDILFAKQ